jgi:hypothetical protein
MVFVFLSSVPRVSCLPLFLCHREREREEMTLVGLTRILLGQKMKKILVVDSASTNGR